MAMFCLSDMDAESANKKLSCEKIDLSGSLFSESKAGTMSPGRMESH